jgi:hypothetical protein
MDGVAQQPQLVGQADLFADILQITQLHAPQPRQLICQFGLLNKGPRGNDHADLRRVAGGLHGLGTRRVIEHGRNALPCGHPENQAQRGHQVGQQQANFFARLRQAFNLATEHQRHLQQVVVGILDLLDVLDQAAPAAKISAASHSAE